MTYNYTDYNDAERQLGELIPNGTICKLVMSIRPGGAGPEGWLTQSQNSEDVLYLSAEFTVLEGPFARRKLWQNFTMQGGKLNEKGESTAANISRSNLRAILESARNIQPTDMGEKAIAARRISGFGDFDSMVFLAKIGIEKGKDGYADKNTIAGIITPDKKEYQANMQQGQAWQAPATAQPVAGARQPDPAAQKQSKPAIPAWAQ